MKTREQNRNNKRTEIKPFDWFIERIQTHLVFGWSSERSAGKTSCPKNFREIALTSYCYTIGQSNNAFSILGFSLAGKRTDRVLVLFIHWLVKQITNTYRNHFSKTYENRSMESIRNRGTFFVKNGMQRGKRLDTGRKLISLTCPTHSTSLRSCNVTAGVGSAKEPCSTILPRSDIIHRYDPC